LRLDGIGIDWAFFREFASISRHDRQYTE
jgi:hypothetical protein